MVGPAIEHPVAATGLSGVRLDASDGFLHDIRLSMLGTLAMTAVAEGIRATTGVQRIGPTPGVDGRFSDRCLFV